MNMPFKLSIILVLTFVPFMLSAQAVNNQVQFSKHRIHQQFVSEGVAVGDVNQDGRIDILAGPYWFEAPDWIAHEIRSPIAFDYTVEWSDSFLNFVLDINQDGWLDFISIGFPGTGAYWYENPKGAAGHWKKYQIDSTACNESPMMADVNQDGSNDLVFGSGNKQMKWFSAPGKSKTNWSQFSISKENAPGTGRFSHGLGFGDINGDSRKDIMVTEGWWEAPKDHHQAFWKFHKAPLGQACSQMHTFDFDNDGDNDLITASAHKFGIWWHEQVSGPDGRITFREHLIDSSFSQTHATALSDLDGDLLPDLVTGKRFFAHNGKDPGGHDPAVIYWFKLQRDNQGKPSWEPHLIDNDSGVGLQVIIMDLNQDGKKDIITANKKGVFFFEQL